MRKSVMTLLVVIALVAATPSYTFAQAPKAVQLVTTSILGMSFGMMIGVVIATMSGNISSGPVIICAAAGFGIGLGIAITTDTDDSREQKSSTGTRDASSGSQSEKASSPQGISP
jgi:hypothetical protein